MQRSTGKFAFQSPPQSLPFNASSASDLATADPVRMQLKKLPISQTSLNPDGNDFRPSPEMEAEFLKHKHLGFQTPEWLENMGQKPLMGFGGEGRKMPSLSEVDEEAREKFWAMMMGDNHNQVVTVSPFPVSRSSRKKTHD